MLFAVPPDSEEQDAAEECPLSAVSSAASSKASSLPHSPILGSKALAIELEVSPDVPPSTIPPLPSSAVAWSNQSGDWDDFHSPDGDGGSAWEKVKHALRNRSSQRRSITDRNDASNSCESPFSSALYHSATPLHSIAASDPPKYQGPKAVPFPGILKLEEQRRARAIRLAQYPKQSESADVVPPASAPDLLNVEDAKLFPFPGMVEEFKRTRAVQSAQSPKQQESTDVVPPSSASDLSKLQDTTFSPFPGLKKSEEESKGAKAGMVVDPATLWSPSCNPPSLPSQGVKRWLNMNKCFSPQSPSPSSPGSLRRPEAEDISSQSSDAESLSTEAASELFSKTSQESKFAALFAASMERMEDYIPGDGGEKRDEGGAEKGTAKDAGHGQTNRRLKSNLAGIQQRSVMPSVRMLNGRTVKADQTPEGLGLEDGDVILVSKSKDLAGGPQTDEFNLQNSRSESPQEANRTLEEIFDGVMGFQSELRELILGADPKSDG